MSSTNRVGWNWVAICFSAAISVFYLPSQATGAVSATYKISEFSCDEEKKVGETIELTVKVRKRGRGGSGVDLTVSGTLNDDPFVLGSVPVVEKETEAKFEYVPDEPGDIVWHALVSGNDQTCMTTVKTDGDGEGDGDDDDDGGGDPPSASGNIIALHDSSSDQYDKNCLECHADVLTESSLDPNIHGPHLVMSPFIPGENEEKKCVWCHRSVDLEQGPQVAGKTSANLRKHVDMNLCTLCHGPARSANQFYMAGPSTTDPDGPQLYDLACAACHGDLQHSEVRGESASEITDEILEDEGGMRPLIEALTGPEIEAIADALAN